MPIVTAAKQAASLTGSVMVKHPYRHLKYIHRKPKFKSGSVYVTVDKGEYELGDYSNLDMLTVFYVKPPPLLYFIQKASQRLEASWVKDRLEKTGFDWSWVKDDYRLGIWCAEFGQYSNDEQIVSFYESDPSDSDWDWIIKQVRFKAGL